MAAGGKILVQYTYIRNLSVIICKTRYLDSFVASLKLVTFNSQISEDFLKINPTMNRSAWQGWNANLSFIKSLLIETIYLRLYSIDKESIPLLVILKPHSENCREDKISD